MPWDGYPQVINGRKRTAKQVLQEDVAPSAIAVYANLTAGTAYAAVPFEDGQVHAYFFHVEQHDSDGETMIAFKQFAVEESPYRWPAAVANVITHW